MEEDKKSTVQWGNKIYDLDEPDGMKDFVHFIYKDILFFPKSIPSNNKIIYWFIFLTLLIIGLGIFLSINFNNWLWFSRSGSICTVIAVLFTFYDVSDYYDKKLDAIERTYAFITMIYGGWCDKILAMKNLPDKEKEEIMTLKDKILKEIEEGRKSVNYLDIKQEERIQRNQLRRCEICILIVSTLIWGLGDLIS